MGHHIAHPPEAIDLNGLARIEMNDTCETHICNY